MKSIIVCHSAQLWHLKIIHRIKIITKAKIKEKRKHKRQKRKNGEYADQD